MSGVIRWEEPPAHGGGRGNATRVRNDWHGVAEELQQRAGEWAVVAESETFSAVSALANNIRSGFLVAFRPAQSFDAVCRNVGGRQVIYARYVGEPS